MGKASSLSVGEDNNAPGNAEPLLVRQGCVDQEFLVEVDAAGEGFE